MGDQGVHVEVAALHAVADRFDRTAELAGQAARTRLVFDGACAGRAHAEHADGLRRALGDLMADLALWSRAATEIGAGLRHGATRYAAAEHAAAAGMD
jgi:Excreted virulence factor EspC, type VII ESX diderm